MKITIYGSGCVMCGGLGKNIKEALDDLSVRDVELERVCDPNEMAEAGVSNPPALAVNGEVVFSGRIPEADEILQILKDRQ